MHRSELLSQSYAQKPTPTIVEADSTQVIPAQGPLHHDAQHSQADHRIGLAHKVVPNRAIPPTASHLQKRDRYCQSKLQGLPTPAL